MPGFAEMLEFGPAQWFFIGGAIHPGFKEPLNKKLSWDCFMFGYLLMESGIILHIS